MSANWMEPIIGDRALIAAITRITINCWCRVDNRAVSLFLCGDVMKSREVGQVLQTPGEAGLFQPGAGSVTTWVESAVASTGPLPHRVGVEYAWGDALQELQRIRPAARIVNLATAVTLSSEAWPRKRQMLCRMAPADVPCLNAVEIDCCVLANNHVLDWGRPGLRETLSTLHGAGIRTAGAGLSEAEAAAPAIIDVPGGARLLVFGFALKSGGVPREWRAATARAGVNWVPDLSERSLEAVRRQISSYRRAGCLVIASIHWGGSWGFGVSEEEREFAHRLIDAAGVDVVHGHSSSHAKGIEIYRRKLILYGCGDLLNDFEGGGAHKYLRPELALMYFPTLDAESGELLSLVMVPMRAQDFRLNTVSARAAARFAATLNLECNKLGAHITQQPDARLALQWEGSRT